MRPMQCALLIFFTCLMPDDFTHQWGSSATKWVKLAKADFPETFLLVSKARIKYVHDDERAYFCINKNKNIYNDWSIVILTSFQTIYTIKYTVIERNGQRQNDSDDGDCINNRNSYTEGHGHNKPGNKHPVLIIDWPILVLLQAEIPWSV